ncbi:hypothetical protein M413DRAFT_14631 [Hebeloma cylindrosporum]|uniref:Uncharacterized protein n=1 Tax=Hebeloma cylindrosporum TaxID=76867 RepID=A0A0C3BEU7_HEBCY|nr:hypothetical protein M413DRAFT_14631 [Hebeloma cylindrosporum h7]
MIPKKTVKVPRSNDHHHRFLPTIPAREDRRRWRHRSVECRGEYGKIKLGCRASITSRVTDFVSTRERKEPTDQGDKEDQRLDVDKGRKRSRVYVKTTMEPRNQIGGTWNGIDTPGRGENISVHLTLYRPDNKFLVPHTIPTFTGGVIVAFSISLLSFANDLKANNHIDGPAFLTIVLLYFSTAGGSLFIAVVLGILAVLPQRQTSNGRRYKLGIVLLTTFLSLMLLGMLAGLIYMANSITIDDAGEAGRFHLDSVILYPLISALLLLLTVFLFWLFRFG